MTTKVFDGKPDAGNSHIAPSRGAKPSRGSRLYNIKKLVTGLSIATGTVAFAASPQIGDVSFSNDGHSAEITYTLSGAPAVVTMEVQTNTLDSGAGDWVDIGGENVQTVDGDVNRIVREVGTTRRIVWKAYKDIPNRRIGAGRIRAKLTAWATNAPPDWMVVGLQKLNDIRFYASTNYLPQGFSNDRSNSLYKTHAILMRKIPAHGVVWMSGLPPESSSYDTYDAVVRTGNDQRHLVMLTKDYYMGVYTVTQRQYMDIMGDSRNNSRYKGDSLPVTNVGYDDIRGYEAIDSTNNLNDADIWPQAGHRVGSNCFMDKLRKYAGFDGFDLPTQAQWEYACRAGTTSLYNNGRSDGNFEIGWYYGNSEYDSIAKRYKYSEVGLKLPNAWSLYDMHGNVEECVLDRASYGNDYLSSFAPGWERGAVTFDPVGASVNTIARCFRKLGGSAQEGSKVSYSGSRPWGGWLYKDTFIGFRLWCSADFN